MMEPSDEKDQDEVDDYQNVGTRGDDYQNVGKRVDDYQNVDNKKVDDYQNVDNRRAINMLHPRLQNLMDDNIFKDDGIVDEALEIIAAKNRARAEQALP